MLHGLTPSFPTRRSSDLRTWRRFSIAAVRGGTRLAARQSTGEACALARFGVELDPAAMQLDQAFREGEAEPRPRLARMGGAALKLLEDRSEEHTSELQSLMRISYAVFCLKKNTKT